MDLKGFRKRWAAGQEPADSVGSPSTPPLGSEPGASLAVHDSGQHLGGYQQLSSASSSETVQYIPQTHVEQTGMSTALSVLRSSKRVKMPCESGPLAPIFNREFQQAI